MLHLVQNNNPNFKITFKIATMAVYCRIN